jgi:1,4-dihydroxy-2-naphthoate octaprenyltransferase
MIKTNLNDLSKSSGIGWIFGAILGLVLFSICTYLIEDFGFIIGVSIGLGAGSTIGMIIEINNYKNISQDEIIEKKHLLYSSMLLIIFGIIMIAYFLFNYA